MSFNPDNIPTEKLGEGYRFLTVEEANMFIPCDGWGSVDIWWGNDWEPYHWEINMYKNRTFRTRLSPEEYIKHSKQCKASLAACMEYQAYMEYQLTQNTNARWYVSEND